MKRFNTVPGAMLGMVLLIFTTGTLASDIVIKRVPLEWQHIAQNDGGQVYSNLCAVCHGTSGKGDGPAAGKLKEAVPNLTILAAKNGGVYSHKDVASTIFGDTHTVANNALGMPAWGEQFMYVGRGWHSVPKRKLAQDRIQALTRHVESLQLE